MSSDYLRGIDFWYFLFLKNYVIIRYRDFMLKEKVLYNSFENRYNILFFKGSMWNIFLFYVYFNISGLIVDVKIVFNLGKYFWSVIIIVSYKFYSR